MHAIGNRSGRPTALAARYLLAIGSAVLATNALATVVTPTNLQGWTFYDGNGANPSPAQITGTRPDAGNGSLEFDINAGNQQPAAYHALTPISFASLVAAGNTTSLGFDWLALAGNAAGTGGPTIRLFLSGITAPGSTSTSGSLGWYGSTTGSWQSTSLSATAGDFFFRISNPNGGQEQLDCTARNGSFDDRRQSLTAWYNTCNGSGTGATATANIDNATVTGIEIDWGTFPGNTATMATFADLINYNLSAGNVSNIGNFNFELRASAVPEPESLTLMLLGGVAAGVGLRARRRRAAATAG